MHSFDSVAPRELIDCLTLRQGIHISQPDALDSILMADILWLLVIWERDVLAIAADDGSLVDRFMSTGYTL